MFSGLKQDYEDRAGRMTNAKVNGEEEEKERGMATFYVHYGRRGDSSTQCSCLPQGPTTGILYFWNKQRRSFHLTCLSHLVPTGTRPCASGPAPRTDDIDI